MKNGNLNKSLNQEAKTHPAKAVEDLKRWLYMNWNALKIATAKSAIKKTCNTAKVGCNKNKDSSNGQPIVVGSKTVTRGIINSKFDLWLEVKNLMSPLFHRITIAAMNSDSSISEFIGM